MYRLVQLDPSDLSHYTCLKWLLQGLTNLYKKAKYNELVSKYQNYLILVPLNKYATIVIIQNLKYDFDKGELKFLLWELKLIILHCVSACVFHAVPEASNSQCNWEPPKCWDYKHVPSHLVLCGAETKPTISRMLGKHSPDDLQPPCIILHTPVNVKCFQNITLLTALILSPPPLWIFNARSINLNKLSIFVSLSICENLLTTVLSSTVRGLSYCLSTFCFTGNFMKFHMIKKTDSHFKEIILIKALLSQKKKVRRISGYLRGSRVQLNEQEIHGQFGQKKLEKHTTCNSTTQHLKLSKLQRNLYHSVFIQSFFCLREMLKQKS